MTEESFSNISIAQSLNETSSEVSLLKNEVTILRNKNEEYQQTIHVMRREFNSTNAMYQEVKELLEEASSQQSNKFDQMIQDITIKHNEERKIFRNRIEELEEELNSKTMQIQDLEIVIIDLKRSQEKMPPILEETTIEAKAEQQEYDIKELFSSLQEKDEKILQLEHDNSNFQTQIAELQDIVEGFRKCLNEKIQIIESTQEELVDCRLELNTLKMSPVVDSLKGNSLFAEVEDRRKMMMDKMNSMRNSYLEMKRSFASKENEIKILKTERAALIRKWEDTTSEAVEQETTLVDAYKKRITDLENRLKSEQKKIKQMQNEQQSGSNISYFQSLLNSKKKEIEELQTQIENNSIRTLLKEERSCKLGNRLRYWRFKAMALEANLSAVQSHLQSDPNSSTVEILQMIKNQMSDKTLKVDDIDDEIELSLKLKIVDETSVSLDSLIQPKPIFPPNLSSVSLNSVSSEMSLTSIVDNCSFDSNQTILANSDSNSMQTACKTLNFTSDMSFTQIIETEETDTTLIVKNEEDLSNFKPSSTSSVLQEKHQKMDPVPNKNYETNKENIGENSSILKSVLSKVSKEKEKKTLRFTEDTEEPKGYIRRLKEQQRKYPIVHISSKPNE